MVKKLLFGFVLIILLSSFVLSAPPFEPSETAGKLEIVYPGYNYYKLDSNITLNYHVYNSSGYPLNGSEVTCELTIINQKGEFQEQGNLVYNSSTKILYYLFNYSENECCVNYEWAVVCNSTSEYGSARGGFQINRVGEDTEQNSMVLLIIFLMLGLFLVVSFSGFNKCKNKYYKLIFGNLSTLLIMITVRMCAWFVELAFPVATSLIKTMNVFYSWATTLFYFGLGISLLLLVYYILSDLLQRKKSKQNDWGVGKL